MDKLREALVNARFLRSFFSDAPAHASMEQINEALGFVDQDLAG